MELVPILLDALVPELARLAPTEEAATQALEAARKLAHLTSCHSYGGDQNRLQRQLVALSSSLASLAAAASRALSRGTAPPWLPAQVEAGCFALSTCAKLACSIQPLPLEVAQKIGAAFALVFGPGTVLLELLVREAVTAASDAMPLVAMCGTQLLAVGIGLGQTLPASGQPSTMEAFAAGTGKPGALLPWLTTAACAVACLGSIPSPVIRRELTANFMFVVDELLTHEPFAAHRQQLAADAALQQAAAEVLVTLCPRDLADILRSDLEAGLPLGSQPPVRSVPLLRLLPTVLLHPCLAPAVRQRLLAGESLAALRAAADVVHALPLPGSAAVAQLGGGNTMICLLHYHAQRLLRASLSGLLATIQEEGSGSGTQQAAAAAAAAAADTSNSSGGSEPTGQAGPGGSGSAASAAVTAAGSSSADLQAAAWQLVSLVPRLVATIQAYSDGLPDEGAPDWLPDAEAACANLASSLQLLSCLADRPAPLPQLASWVEAAIASIRLQPALLRLDAAFKQLGEPLESSRHASNGAQQLAKQLGHEMWHNLPAGENLTRLPATASTRAAQHSLALSTWQLHSAFARLCHWVLDQDSPRLLWAPSLSQGQLCSFLTGRLMIFLNGATEAILAWRRSCGDQRPGQVSDEAAPELQALCAAHAVVLARLVEAERAAAATEPPDAHSPLVSPAAMLDSLARLGAFLSPAVTPLLDGALEAALAPLLQSAEERRKLDVQLAMVAQMATKSFHLTVAAASSSLLGLLLQMPVDLASGAGDEGDEMGAYAFANGWGELVAAVADAASSAVDNAAETGTPDSLAAELKRGAHSLRQQRRQVLDGLDPDASPTQRAEELRQLLQPAQQVAGLLRQWLQLPGTAREEQLVLCRAAAVRSCAYLRCANVAGQGGPAFGQGVDSKRCSACRVVWYCGTACSHADWRAGHKRVCKVLAAERQEFRAGMAAAAAAEGGTVAQQ